MDREERHKDYLQMEKDQRVIVAVFVEVQHVFHNKVFLVLECKDCQKARVLEQPLSVERMESKVEDRKDLGR